MIAWFRGRTVREQRLIAVMLGLAALTVLWAGVVMPIRDALSSTRERYDDAVIRVGAAQAGADAVRRATRRMGPGQMGAGLGAPLADAVRVRADQAGLALASLEPEAADRIRIAISVARPGALFGWLAGLEGDGILVDRVAVTPNPDRTVSVQATLVERRP